MGVVKADGIVRCNDDCCDAMTIVHCQSDWNVPSIVCAWNRSWRIAMEGQMATEKQYAPLLSGWDNDVSVDTLPEEARAQYLAMRDHNRKAAEARAAFEEIIQAGMPHNTHAVFNYRFGKLAMAVAKGEVDDKPRVERKPGKSLDAFYAAAEAAGRRV
jgi:hypothetical protein